MSFKTTLSKEGYNLLKNKALEDKLDGKVWIKGGLWMPEWGCYEKCDFYFLCREGDEIYQVPSNIQIAPAWKGYQFPYSNVSIKPLPDGIDHLVLVTLPRD